MLECAICRVPYEELILHEVGLSVCFHCKPEVDRAAEMLKMMTHVVVEHLHHAHAPAA